MIFVVLGMHKSGTTLISRLLHESGINMGTFDPRITYDNGNQYERLEFKQVNMNLLESEGQFSLDVKTPLPKSYTDEVASTNISTLCESLEQKYVNWGFKDPRTVLTYRFFDSSMPDHKTIFVFRSPTEVWNHYQKKIPKYRVLKRFIRGIKALRAWLVYNSELLNYFNSSNQEFIMFEYASFMENDVGITKLSEFVGQELKDVRDKKLFRAGRKAGKRYKLATMLLKNYGNIETLYLSLKRSSTF